MKYPKRSQYRYAKSSYRIRNWAEYEAGLRRRGDRFGSTSRTITKKNSESTAVPLRSQHSTTKRGPYT